MVIIRQNHKQSYQRSNRNDHAFSVMATEYHERAKKIALRVILLNNWHKYNVTVHRARI